MTAPINSFMRAVLGDPAAAALSKAADRSDALGSVLGPRTIVGWLALASRWDYEGEIPGLDGSHLAFRKNESTSLFDGSVTIESETYDFQHANITHLAAALSCALGVNGQVAKNLKDSDLTALGKNVDLLLKMRVVDALRKECKCGKEECEKCQKVELPGQAAAPKGPQEPQAPEQPTATAPKTNKQLPPKNPTLKVTKSQAARKCSVCEASQFRKGEFAGCYCLRDLARHATSVPTSQGGFEITFGSEWTRSNMSVLIDILGVGDES